MNERKKEEENGWVNLNLLLNWWNWIYLNFKSKNELNKRSSRNTKNYIKEMQLQICCLSKKNLKY